MSDHYEILGLPRSFRLDLKELEARYRELTRLLHPDRHAASGAAARRMALEKTIQVNDAYRTLKDPSRRAAWLLLQEGIDLEEEGTGAAKHLPPDFLFEVMEERESFDDARASKDFAKVEQLKSSARQSREAALKSMEAAFERGDHEAAAQSLSILRYHDRFLGEIRAWEDANFEERHG